MTHNKKFLFDLNNFDPEAPQEDIIVEEVIEEVEPPPPSFSTEELEAAKSIAFESGRQDGAKQERKTRDQKNTEVLQQLATQFETILAAESYREKQYERESLRLSLEVIEQLVPALHHIIGKDTLRQILPDIICSQSQQSEITIKIHPDNAAAIDTMLENLTENNSASDRFKVFADSDLDIGGCSVSWKDGGMVRDHDKSVKEMKNSILTLLLGDEKNAGLTEALNNGIKEEEVFDSNEKSAVLTEDGDSE